MAKFSLSDFLSFLNRLVPSNVVPFDKKRQKLHILYAAFACVGDFSRPAQLATACRPASRRPEDKSNIQLANRCHAQRRHRGAPSCWRLCVVVLLTMTSGGRHESPTFYT